MYMRLFYTGQQQKKNYIVYKIIDGHFVRCVCACARARYVIEMHIYILIFTLFLFIEMLTSFLCVVRRCVCVVVVYFSAIFLITLGNLRGNT